MRSFFVTSLDHIDRRVRAGFLPAIGLSLLIGGAVPLVLSPRAPAMNSRGAAVVATFAVPTVSARAEVDAAALPVARSTPRASARSTPQVVAAPPETDRLQASLVRTPVAPALPETNSLPPLAPTPTTPIAIVSGMPLQTVEAFYQLVDDKQFGAAEGLWTQHMRDVFPPAENIVGRFAQTQRLTLEDIQLLMLDDVTGLATVRVAVSEVVPAAGTRRYRGTWDLVRAGQAWFLDQPDLRLE
jgi:hypothetical protein